MLHGLMELRLIFSKLYDDPLRFLHGLPNLQRLFFLRAYEGEELHFEEGGFQNGHDSLQVGLVAVQPGRRLLRVSEAMATRWKILASLHGLLRSQQRRHRSTEAAKKTHSG